MNRREAAQTAARPAAPHDETGPVFAAPWQAQAFAIAVELVERGQVSPAEWAEALGAEVAAASAGDNADEYYLHWLAALERLLVAKSLSSEGELADRRQAWREAAAATPHGEPIELANGRATM